MVFPKEATWRTPFMFLFKRHLENLNGGAVRTLGHDTGSQWTNVKDMKILMASDLAMALARVWRSFLGHCTLGMMLYFYFAKSCFHAMKF